MNARTFSSLVLLVLLVMGLPSAGVTATHAATLVEFADSSSVAARSLLLDGAMAGRRIVVVGERGHVLHSDDGGVSWTQATVPSRATLTGLFFVDDELGWAVGHDSTILRTRDRGDSWELVHIDIGSDRPLFDVWFSDPLNGIAVGAYGLYLSTKNGGNSWEIEELKVDKALTMGQDADLFEANDFHLNHISRANNGALYLAAEAGTVLRSRDGGVSWQSLPLPYHGSFFSSLPLDGHGVLVLGLRGHLYRSDAGGVNWGRVQVPTDAMLTDATRLRDGAIVLVGLAGTVLVSSDGGSYFKSHQLSDRQGLTSVFETPTGEVMLVGEFGVAKASQFGVLGPLH